METVHKGIYIYEDSFINTKDAHLPNELVLSDVISVEAVLIRLLCGTINIKYMNRENQEVIVQRINYSLPGNMENSTFKNKIFRDFFSFEYFRKTEKKNIDKYLNFNRRNHFVHEELLSELTSAIVWLKISPIESFVHIYRALEFISYAFPLIYASKSMDYRGSYEKLKKFMSGDSDGELKFLKMFLMELFKDNILFNYEFDILFISNNMELIREEFQMIISSNYYVFEGETLKIRFANIADLLITLRNRYFHMLIGKGMNNFYDIRYDKREVFYALNPIFINWIAMIYKEIVSYLVGIVI